MANSTIARQPYWLNKSRMAESLGISTQAFDKWGVEPVAKIGREAFYDTRSVLENRLQHLEGKQQPGTLENHNLDPWLSKSSCRSAFASRRARPMPRKCAMR